MNIQIMRPEIESGNQNEKAKLQIKIPVFKGGYFKKSFKTKNSDCLHIANTT